MCVLQNMKKALENACSGSPLGGIPYDQAMRLLRQYGVTNGCVDDDPRSTFSYYVDLMIDPLTHMVNGVIFEPNVAENF